MYSFPRRSLCNDFANPRAGQLQRFDESLIPQIKDVVYNFSKLSELGDTLNHLLFYSVFASDKDFPVSLHWKKNRKTRPKRSLFRILTNNLYWAETFLPTKLSRHRRMRVPYSLTAWQINMLTILMASLLW